MCETDDLTAQNYQLLDGSKALDDKLSYDTFLWHKKGFRDIQFPHHPISLQ